MNKILGLDLGTNSIGWAIRNPELNGNQIEEKGVVIFPKGVGEEKNNEFSLAAERSQNRQMRKQYARRKQRKADLLEVLIENNMCPIKTEELKRWSKYRKGMKAQYPASEAFKNWLRLDFDNDGKPDYTNPYELRKAAIERKITLLEFGRALYHLNQRRGYKSNRLDSSDDEKGKVNEAINKTREKLNGNTYGSLAAELLQKGERVRRGNKEVTNVSRGMLESEFEKMIEMQSIDSALQQKIHDIIFLQRPLKSKKEHVGKCTFEKTKPRCPVSHPDYEEFRAWQFVNSIKVKDAFNPEAQYEQLNPAQKEIAYSRFLLKRTSFKFEDIAKNVSGGKYNKEKKAWVNAKSGEAYKFNYPNYQSITSSPVSAWLKSIFGEDWNQIEIPYTTFYKGKTKKGTYDIHDIWHVLSTFDDDHKLKEFATEKLLLDEEQTKTFLSTPIRQGYARLSRKAIIKILPYLREGHIYSYAALLANMEAVLGHKFWQQAEKDIKEAVKAILDNHRLENKKKAIVNAAFDNRRESFEELYEEYYGKNTWDEMPDSEKEEIRKFVENTYEKQVQKRGAAKFLPIERLDEKVKNFLQDNFLSDLTNDEVDSALAKLYHPSDIDIYPDAKPAEDGNRYLGNPDTGAFKNPMAMRMMYELKKLINYMIKNGMIDEQTKVIVEMARDLNDSNRRAAIHQMNRTKEEENKKFVKTLQETCGIKNPTKTDVLKYRLWEEQNHICLYTGKAINITEAFGENSKFDIEHTLPRSQCFDNSQENKTLSDLNYNRNIKINKIPTELDNFDQEGYGFSAIKPRLEKWREKVEELNKEIAKKSTNWATTKEQKDRIIRQRHLLKMDRDYLKGKLERFEVGEIKSTFKNSQLVDTRIITKYARAYLKSVFPKVYTVKGTVVDDAKRGWGIMQQYEKKERVNHIHHAIDAVTATCLTKEISDKLAHYFKQIDEFKYEGKSKPRLETPWGNFESFKENVLGIEQDTLIKHINRDNTLKQTKKKLRKRGKIQYTLKENLPEEMKAKKEGKDYFKIEQNGKTIYKVPIYQQGMGLRGQLHKETFYGAIERPQTDKLGKIKIDKEGEPLTEKRFVQRKFVTDLKESDIKNIVDDNVREIIDKGKNIEKHLSKELDKLKKKLYKANDAEESELNRQIEEIKDKVNNIYSLPNKNGDPIPIKKVRMFANDVKSPLKIKKQRDISKQGKYFKKDNENNDWYKEWYYVKNEENYLLALYEGEVNGRVRRGFEAVNLLQTAKIMQSNFHSNLYPENIIINQGKRSEGILPFKTAIKKGMLVIFYENSPNELQNLTKQDISTRLYKIVKFDKAGRIYFRPHFEARPASDLNESYTLEINEPAEQLRLTHNNFNALIEGVDFEMTPTGEIDLTAHT